MMGWHPGIGDPSPFAWAVVLAYFLAAACAVGAARVSTAREARFWYGAAACCALLAINKQLDLQTLLTTVGRVLAHRQGWYEQRHVAQLAFIAIGCGAVAVGFAMVGRWLRGSSGWAWLGLAGLAWLAIFVLARATSFSHVDHLISSPVLGITGNHLAEVGGILVVAVAAVGRFSSRQRAA